jgi:hypothetical protein
VLRVRPDGGLDSGFRVPAPGADGVVVAGDDLYVAEITDPQSTVLRVPLAHPEQAAPVARLGDDGVPRLIDDLDLGPDGALYVASALGSVFRIDPATGSACTLLSGLPPLASARFASGFAPYDARRGDLFVSSEAGVVDHIRIHGLQPLPLPAMQLSLSPRTVTARARHTIRAVVRSQSASCRSGVTVHFGRQAVLTDSRGRATLRIVRRSRGRRTLRATKTGCRRALAPLRIR